MIGGGFGGLLAGARLRQAGVESIRMIDPGGDFGGTWYWNRYPGIACDIESLTYCRCWKRSATCRRRSTPTATRSSITARPSRGKFDLYRDTCFQTRVEELRWDEVVVALDPRTNRGDRHARSLRRAWRRARSIDRSSPAFPASRSSRALLPHQPLGLRLHRRRLEGRPDRAARQAGRRSSAPARRRCSACRTSASGPSICTCSSARRRRST